jgi:hypothetical protein
VAELKVDDKIKNGGGKVMVFERVDNVYFPHWLYGKNPETGEFLSWSFQEMNSFEIIRDSEVENIVEQAEGLIAEFNRLVTINDLLAELPDFLDKIDEVKNDEMLRIELLFAKDVLEAIENDTIEEKNILLLFDIDETLIVRFGYNEETKVAARPILKILFEFIYKKFPNLVLGILSDSSKNRIEWLFGDSFDPKTNESGIVFNTIKKIVIKI